MKKSVLTFVTIVLLTVSSFAQVAINTTGANPNESAILDLSSDSKGLLIPRMTTNNRTNDVTAVGGLLVFDTDTDSFWYYDSSQSTWVELGTTTNNDWTKSGNNIYSAVSGNVGIGTTTPHHKFTIRDGNMSLVSEGSDSYIYLGSDELANSFASYLWTDDNVGFAIGSTEGVPQMVVKNSNGNVGIGTTNPSKKLTIRDGNMSMVSEGSDAYIHLGSNGLGDAIGSYIWTKDNVGFSVGKTEGVPQLVVKNSNGNVGIGTSNPSTKLEVAGQIKITGGNPGAGRVLTSDENGAATWSSPFVYATSINDLSDAEADAANLFLGDDSGINNSGLNFNTGIGIEALKTNTSGISNTATGMGALQYNSTGYENTANGHLALQKNTTGNANIAFGKEALLNNTTKSNLTAIGYQSLYWNGTGAASSNQSIENTAVGSKTLFSNTLGSQNTAIGNEALKANVTGNSNTAIGVYSLGSNTEGQQNTAVGVSALTNNTTADGNTAFGYKASYNVSTGGYNSSFGINSLYSTTAGINNSAFSYGSLFLNQTGDENTANGYKALYSNVSGNQNTAIGSQAGYRTTGSGNVFIGNKAGYNSLLSNKLFIDNTDTDAPLIYGDFYWNKVGINGHLGVNTIDPQYHFHVNGNAKINEYLRVGEYLHVGENITVVDDINVGDDIYVTGDYKYASAKTKILTIPAASFGLSTNQDADKMAFDVDGYWHITNDDGNGAYNLQAGVNLPEGAIVTRFSIFYMCYKESITVSLKKRVKVSGTATMAQITVATSVLTNDQFDDTSITSPNIANSDNFYFITAEFTGHDDLDLGVLYGAEIEYTITELQ